MGSRFLVFLLLQQNLQILLALSDIKNLLNCSKSCAYHSKFLCKTIGYKITYSFIFLGICTSHIQQFQSFTFYNLFGSRINGTIYYSQVHVSNRATRLRPLFYQGSPCISYKSYNYCKVTFNLSERNVFRESVTILITTHLHLKF